MEFAPRLNFSSDITIDIDHPPSKKMKTKQKFYAKNLFVLVRINRSVAIAIERTITLLTIFNLVSKFDGMTETTTINLK